jgi:hypothetical protein
MNAAIFTKSAKGLILASGLIAASNVMGYAADATISLGSQATLPLNSLYVSAPTGTTSLGGHSFDLSGGNLIQLGNGQSASFSGSWSNATSAYLLLNSYNTYLWFDQTVIGNVTVTFSDGTTQSTDLTVGGNIREWRIGSGFTDDTISDPAAAQVWTGAAQGSMGGGTAVIDMLTITLPGKTVTNITLNDTNTWGAIMIDLAGLTIDPVAPQPTTSCIRPGASCDTPAAQNSQAWKWQPTAPGTTNTNPHANANSNGNANGNANGAHNHKSS